MKINSISKQSTLDIQIIIVTSLLAFSLPCWASSETNGWDALWGNQYVSAEEHFLAAREQDDENMSALRGLMLARSALGRDMSLVKDLEEYGKEAPHSPYDLLMLEWLDQYNGLENKEYYEVLAEYAQNISQSDDLGLVDRRLALDSLAKYFRLLGKADELVDTAENLHRITNWRMLGPFDNTSGSGHQKDFIDVDHLPAGATYKGKFGQRISWFKPEMVGLTGEISPTRHFYKRTNTTAYARTQIKIGQSGRFLLSLGYSGDVIVYVNGHIVFEGNRKSGGNEVAHREIDLAKGWTNISIKISNKYADSWFTCSLTNPDGSGIDDLETDPFSNGHSYFDPSNITTVKSNMMVRISELVQNDPSDTEAVFWNFLRQKIESDSDDLLNICKTNLKKFSDNCLIRLVIIETYNQNEVSFKKLLRETAELAPNLTHAKLGLSMEEMEKRRYKKARILAQEVIDISRNCLEAHKILIESLADDQLWSDVKSAAEKVERLFPMEPYPYLVLAEYYSEKGLRSKVQEYQKKAIKRMLPGSETEVKFMDGWEKEDFKDARKAMKRMVDIDPGSSIKWYYYVWSLLASDKIDDAFSYTCLCLESFPQDVNLLVILADYIESGFVISDERYYPVLSSDGRAKVNKWKHGSSAVIRYSVVQKQLKLLMKDEAARVLIRALNSAPENMALREKIASLQGKTSYRVILHDPKIEEIEATRIDASDYPGEDSVILLKSNRRLVFEPGVCLLDNILAVQVLNNDGIEFWENYDLAYAYDSDVVVLNKSILKNNGSEDEGRRYLDKIMFPGLEPGDVIFLHYQVIEISAGHLAGNFWDHNFFSSGVSPVLKSTYQLVMVKPQEIRHNLWNPRMTDPDNLPQVTHDKYGFKTFLWVLHDLPRAGSEMMELDARQIYPWLDLSTIDSWGQIAKWYEGLSGGQKIISPKIKDKAVELTEECTTDKEKIAAIYNFVANSVTYESVPFFQTAYIPRLPSETLRDLFGDCKDKACLMISMLEALNFEGFSFALVSPDAPSNSPFLPSPRFNHVIVCQKNESGGWNWFDPTLENVEAGQIPQYLGNVPALVIDTKTNDLVTIPKSRHSEYPYDSHSVVTLKPDGTGEIKRQETIRQIEHLAQLRSFFNGKTQKELIEIQAEKLSNQFPGTIVGKVIVAGQTPGKSEMTVNTDFEIPYFGEFDQGILPLKLPWSSQFLDNIGAVASSSRRLTSLNLSLLNLCENDEVEIVFPASKRLTKIPDDIFYQWNKCTYSVVFQKTSTGLVVNRNLTVEGERVNFNQYSDFKKWFDSVRRDLGRTQNLRVN